MNLHKMALLLDNRPGVLARVCMVLHRHASNIESLELHTPDGATARAAMTVRCPDNELGLITARLRSLVNVRHVSTGTKSNATGSQAQQSTTST